MMLKKKKNLPCSKYMDTFDYILIGDAEVGKTSLLNRFCYDFYSSYKKKKKRPEIFTISTINDNREFKLQFWDLPMNDNNIEDYKKILQKADGIIFVCSYNKKESLKRILIWNKLLSSHIDMSKKIQQYLSIKTIWNMMWKFLKMILKELAMKLIQIIIQ